METGELVVMGVAAVATVAFPIWFFRSFRSAAQRSGVMVEQLLAAYRPEQTLVESALALGTAVELRAQAVQGALRLWLDSEVSSVRGSWSATGTLSFRAVPEGAGYRADHATVEVPFRVGEDSEGSVTSVSVPAGAAGIKGPTGVLSMVGSAGGRMLQLAELGPFAPGTELFVRIVVAELSGAERATFRALIGVSPV
jgi:hypothetical protein